jgi:uncharacterized damage-inducible protein DinB
MTSLDQRLNPGLPAADPELGRLLWAFEDTRTRSLAALDGIDQTELDWSEPGIENTIGSVLYHIALIEADYLFMDILGIDYPDWPAWLEDALPHPDRDDKGHLSVVRDVPLAAHLGLLERVRTEFLRLVAPLTTEEFHASRAIPEAGYEISPAWTLHHLMQHEAEHRGQITAIRALYAAR